LNPIFSKSIRGEKIKEIGAHANGTLRIKFFSSWEEEINQVLVTISLLGLSELLT
jgi:hypothetical protein